MTFHPPLSVAVKGSPFLDSPPFPLIFLFIFSCSVTAETMGTFPRRKVKEKKKISGSTVLHTPIMGSKTGVEERRKERGKESFCFDFDLNFFF